MKSATSILGISISLLLGTGPASLAYAQASPDDVLAVTRYEPEDDQPIGIRAGNFIIKPGFEVVSIYDNNIFRTPSAAVKDWITDVKPGIGVQSNWNRHSVAFGALGDIGTYKNNSRLNYTDYGLMASGQYDITYETDLIASVTRDKRHEGVGSLTSVNGDKPVSYTKNAEQLQFNRTLGLIKLIVTGRNENVSLSNDTSGSGILAADDLTERNDKSLSATLRFESMPGNNVFLTGTYDVSHYNIAGTGEASSKGSNIRSGIDYNNGGNLDGSIYGGYLLRSYSGGLNDTTDPYFGCTVNWNITHLTTLSLALDKTFNQSTVTGAAGIVQTSRKATLHQGFTTRVSGEFSLGLDDNDYIGGTENNLQTKVKSASLSGLYQFSDKLGMRVGYTREDRDSDTVSARYTDNRFLISLVYMH
jgi:hypothetical protein